MEIRYVEGNLLSHNTMNMQIKPIGASLKDLWKRMFAFSKIEIDVEYLLEKLGEKVGL